MHELKKNIPNFCACSISGRAAIAERRFRKLNCNFPIEVGRSCKCGKLIDWTKLLFLCLCRNFDLSDGIYCIHAARIVFVYIGSNNFCKSGLACTFAKGVMRVSLTFTIIGPKLLPKQMAWGNKWKNANRLLTYKYIPVWEQSLEDEGSLQHMGEMLHEQRRPPLRLV